MTTRQVVASTPRRAARPTCATGRRPQDATHRAATRAAAASARPAMTVHSMAPGNAGKADESGWQPLRAAWAGCAGAPVRLQDSSAPSALAQPDRHAGMQIAAAAARRCRTRPRNRRFRQTPDAALAAQQYSSVAIHPQGIPAVRHRPGGACHGLPTCQDRAPRANSPRSGAPLDQVCRAGSCIRRLPGRLRRGRRVARAPGSAAPTAGGSGYSRAFRPGAIA